MAILIANLGTSDIAIKLDGFNYYLPIFDRGEPNEDLSGLNSDELDIWEKRNNYAELLCDELNVKYTKQESSRGIQIDFLFTEFSQNLLKAYLLDPDTWHNRIRPGRIGGVILDAIKKFELPEIYLFVTNQNPQHKLDTIYLFDILNRWFKQEYNLQLTAQKIPIKVTAKEADELLDYYYQFFAKSIKSDSTVLVSIKGGTPQMQTALKMQALASSVSRLIFIDPQFDISTSLAGKFSDCKLTSYWRYMRTQKYQIVKLLLEENHWDFNGSIQILQDWQAVLKFFISYHVIGYDDIAKSNEAISRIIKTLELGINSFNLDIRSAQLFLQKNYQLNLSKRLASEVNSYDEVLNLYTQCRIYWKLNQIANFLSRMSSFYEAVLEKLARNLGCYADFRRLDNRFDKRDFVGNQIQVRNIAKEVQDWKEILSLLKSLDFWCRQRNNLIHSAEGVSQTRMQELFNQEIKINTVVCAPNYIVKNMAEILKSDMKIVKNEYRHIFVGENQEYYIYSEVKNWVIQTLDT
ncbi:MAG: hypothetical protein V7K76_32560 [Nostoc sp.]|uniref:hypothetical protein n=1 Tax=Nostoc sp. TaxID=1180 RepID=UPI002FFCC237